MKNTIIYLLGFPGTGKYTIAKEICRQTDFKLVDSHLINNPIFSLIPLDGKTKLSDNVWAYTDKIRSIVLDAMINLSPPEYSFVLTNNLYEGDQEDLAIYDQVKNTAEQKRAKLIPIRLLCSPEELQNRIPSTERAERFKQTNPDALDIYLENEIIKTKHPNELTLDVTQRSPKQATKSILNHARNLS